MTGRYDTEEPQSEDTDYWALKHGFIAITPIQVDMTAYAVMDELNKWNLDI